VGVEKVKPLAILPGDWHTGETDPVVKAAIKEICKELKPKYLVINDGYNGLSTNHHIRNQKILLARYAEEGKLIIEDELRAYKEELEEISQWAEHLVLVYSNHDDFLSRYLDRSEFQDDPYNYKISLKLAQALLEEKNPVQYGVEKLFGYKYKDKTTWLKKGEDFILAGANVGAHGHKGANGAKGSPASMEKAYGSSFSGHTHTPQILRGTWIVGTSTYLQLDYNAEGASSWQQTAGLLYPNGARQLINIIDGKWKLK